MFSHDVYQYKHTQTKIRAQLRHFQVALGNQFYKGDYKGKILKKNIFDFSFTPFMTIKEIFLYLKCWDQADKFDTHNADKFDTHIADKFDTHIAMVVDIL